MKLPTKSTCTKGSLIIEAMVAISVVTIFTVSAVSLSWSARLLGPILEKKAAEVSSIRDSVESWASLPGVFSKWFDDASTEFFPLGATSSISTIAHDEKLSFGSSTCEPTSNGKDYATIQPYFYTPGISIGTNNKATDIIAKNNYVYLSADSSNPSDPDLFIVDMRNIVIHNPPMNSLNTGPGLNAIAVAGHYLYAANTSTTNQLQVIDIIDRSNPILVATLRLPLPTSTTTPVIATSITYFDKKIYLGTEKWNGPEFAVIDVSSPTSPIYLGGLEVGSMVKNILIKGDKAYIANAGDNELILADVSDPATPYVVSSMSPLGTSIEEGNKLTFHHDKLWYGRAGGGFGNSAYQELINFSIDESGGSSGLPVSSSTHITGGVYGIAVMDPYLLFVTGNQQLEVWDDTLSAKFRSMDIGIQPVAMSCDRNDLYIATSGPHGFIRLVFF